MSAITMPVEANTRVLINKSLENLGWILDVNNTKRNVFLEQPKRKEELKLLGGERPDYVLYAKDERGEDKAIMVIEAKRPGKRIDAALEQGIRYAKALDAPIVFATDGLFCKSYHTKFDRTPILNGEEVDEFLRETLAIKYLATWEVNTISPKVQYDRKELIKIFDEANNMLRGDGLRAGIERFGEFANILFLKLISENEIIKKESGVPSDFNSACLWDTIKNVDTNARIDYINSIVYKHLNTKYKPDIFTPLTIKSDSILKEIMDKLDPLTLTDVDSDVKGDAFEYFLKESAATKNDLGEYFTPRHIVKTMVKMVNPQVGEKIYDPFCGTGGFLIDSFRHIENTMARTDTNYKTLREETIYGNEITNTARITKMNMILAGDGHSNIHMKDSLANPIDGTREYDDIQADGTIKKRHGYDVVITNMPYSQKTKYGNLYDMPSNNGDSICVQHCMKAINSAADNGRMALVVPEGFLFRKDLSKTRELLLKKCNLQSVISLPQGVFLPYTGVKTNIIYATKVNQKLKASEKRKDFWYFDVKSDGYTLDNHRRKLDSGSDLDKYQEYRKFDEDQRQDMLDVGFEVVPLDKVKENSFILVGSRYRKQVEILSKYDTVALGEVAEYINGFPFKPTDWGKDGMPIIRIQNLTNTSSGINKTLKNDVPEKHQVENGDLLISWSATIGFYIWNGGNSYLNQHIFKVVPNNRILKKFLYFLKDNIIAQINKFVHGGTMTHIVKSDFCNIKIPLPSLDVQQQIVDELNGYQQIVDGATAVVAGYSPKIQIKNNWDIEKLSALCNINTNTIDPAKMFGENAFTYIDISSIENNTGKIETSNEVIGLDAPSRARRIFKRGDILMSTVRPNLKAFGYVDFDPDNCVASTGFAVLSPKNICGKYLYHMLFDDYIGNQLKNAMDKGMYPSVNTSDLEYLDIPFPPLETQKQIVAQIEAEQALVEPSKKLIEVFTKKMQNRINGIWGEAD